MILSPQQIQSESTRKFIHQSTNLQRTLYGKMPGVLNQSILQHTELLHEDGIVQSLVEKTASSKGSTVQKIICMIKRSGEHNYQDTHISILHDVEHLCLLDPCWDSLPCMTPFFYQPSLHRGAPFLRVNAILSGGRASEIHNQHHTQSVQEQGLTLCISTPSDICLLLSTKTSASVLSPFTSILGSAAQVPTKSDLYPFVSI